MIHVLIVENQRLLRDGIEAIIERTDDIKVIGAVDNGETAIKQMEHLKADIVIMDIQLPQMDGIRTTKLIKEKYPEVSVILLTSKVNDLVISGINAGADGFLVKALYAERLLEAIRIAYRGETVLSGEVARMLAGRIRELTMNNKQIFTLRLERLGYSFTKREIDIAFLLKENHTNQQIANKLFLGEGTVKNYISEIYNKLNIRNRAKVIDFFVNIMR
ncbi:response regulator [Oceanobacillus polygoni]|uniref:DNA-binding NarL/FixJ family response regulator n=1 Tax=Oceanobacillus polygoni TaxID=1235259 RepID=A0A9X0YMV3_9BACI|nr:response regulator transcription factor [Oceanobacillus polygoni]MBP2075908.1 DNA-binding NarL/FixJ family response regulator [Oceanobacillus polygoni]